MTAARMTTWLVAGVVALPAAASPTASPPSTAASSPPVRRIVVTPAVPAVAFLVDWRLGPSDSGPTSGAGTPGGSGLVVGTAAPVPPGWTATRSRDAQPAPRVATVRVMNGHEAQWRIDESHRQPEVAFVWTAQGQGVVGGDAIVTAAQALRVTPRWSGGAAPVTLELAVSASRPAPPSNETGGPSGREASLRTTVEVPLDEWLPVARLGEDELQVRVRRH